jgi:hypothetical protein
MRRVPLVEVEQWHSHYFGLVCERAIAQCKLLSDRISSNYCFRCGSVIIENGSHDSHIHFRRTTDKHSDEFANRKGQRFGEMSLYFLYIMLSYDPFETHNDITWLQYAALVHYIYILQEKILIFISARSTWLFNLFIYIHRPSPAATYN